MERPIIKSLTRPKVLINIGALLDIPTGSIVTGNRGESIINGGLAVMTGITGIGNSYKSTIAHYMMLTAMSRVKEAANDTYLITYDTESNISLDRLGTFADRYSNITKDALTENPPTWMVMDKSQYSGDDWAKLIYDTLEAKYKDKSALTKIECFVDPYTKELLEVFIPTFVEIDSFSEFEPMATIELLTGDLSSANTNTYAMKQSLFKTKFLDSYNVHAGRANAYTIFTAHKGKKIDMNANPYSIPKKDLAYLDSDESIKGVSTKFNFLIHNLWKCQSTTKLNNQTTGTAEYPKYATGKDIATDLNIVTLKQLRGKNGASGIVIDIIVSQEEGVLPSLTEFHYIKKSKEGQVGYGISGSNLNYTLDLYPDVKLSRTTIRNKIDNDPRLRRAINITAELLQIKTFFPMLEAAGVLCTPKELYEDIKKLGYDWNEILDTRGYWTINQYSNPIKFLSSMDLLNIRAGKYVPYWLQDKGKKKK
jgi:hypothetical protein